MQTAEVNGIDMAYRDEGAGQPIPVDPRLSAA